MLVLKKVDTTQFDDFRSISLINSLTKNITKILVEILAPRLNDQVSISQNSFTKKGVFMTISCMHKMSSRHYTKSKCPFLFIKLDISRAFDLVIWPFILEIMEALGFSQNGAIVL